MGPNLWKFLGFFLDGRDCPENLWAVWVFNSGNLAFKMHASYEKMPGMGG